MRKKPQIVASVLLPLAFSSAADAHINPGEENVAVGVSFGTLSGVTKERVYDVNDGGRKISQLDWKYRNAAVVQSTLEWQVRPWLTFDAAGWSTLSHKGGKMDDYDWLSPSQEKWTHHSSHPHTLLNYANEWDLSVTGWLVTQPDWRLGLMAGYQQRRFSFNAKGGSYDNNNGAERGVFDDVSVISYTKRYNVPYIGLRSLYRYQQFEAGSSIKYSQWVEAMARDNHHLRSLTFEDETHGQTLWTLSANLGYYVTENTKVYIEGTWNRTMNKKGDDIATYDDGVLNSTTLFKDSAGVESHSFTTSAGLRYNF